MDRSLGIVYQYAPNALTWIDPWGLSAGCGPKKSTKRGYSKKTRAQKPVKLENTV